MLRLSLVTMLFLISLNSNTGAEMKFEKDIIKTHSGDLEITFIGHGTLVFEYGGKVIHVDPWSNLADYSIMPKADIVLVTHEHRDHLDPKAIKQVSTKKTTIILTEACAHQVSGGTVMKNGDVRTIEGIRIEAVPAYNIVNMRSEGVPFHPKGEGSGYVLTFGDTRVYVAGDTENIPEMENLKNIDVAFLPMNLPYTMTPEMAADAARKLQPKILYPYHFGQSDTAKIVQLLSDSPIDVRIRKMQ